ncbi:MAG: TauD/TfdA family dioxygenase [Pseudomonadota bacterium]
MINESVDIRPLSPHVGAEVFGIDLSSPLESSLVIRLHRALAHRHVLFFRDQNITPAEQVAFARHFGPLRTAQRASFGLVDGIPELSVLETDEAKPPNIDHYHPDGIFREHPEFASVLRAVEVPPLGGDTIFTSLTAAYDALSESMKGYVADKYAIHDFMRLHGSPRKARSWKGDAGKGMAKARDANPPVAHPLVRTHPVTGRKCLYLSEVFTTHIEGLPSIESDGLLRFLVQHACKPEFQYRFRWAPNSIAMWDNRASMHYAVADYWPARRLMHRLTIERTDLDPDD